MEGVADAEKISYIELSIDHNFLWWWAGQEKSERPRLRN